MLVAIGDAHVKDMRWAVCGFTSWSPKHSDGRLSSLMTNDVASLDIEEDLLTAEEWGRELVHKNVTQRLVDGSISFFQPMKNNSKPFGTMYSTMIPCKNDETKFLSAERKLIQRLFNASLAGCKIKMDEILTHELSPVPLSLAKINGDMNSTMLTILTNDLGIKLLHSQPLHTPQHRTCMLFHGHASIQSLGNPCQCNSFNDYAEVLFKKVSSCLHNDIKQVHIILIHINNSQLRYQQDPSVHPRKDQ